MLFFGSELNNGNYYSLIILRIWNRSILRDLNFRDFDELPFFKVIKCRKTSNYWCLFFKLPFLYFIES